MIGKLPRLFGPVLLIILECYWLGATRCEIPGADSFEHALVVRLPRESAVGQIFTAGRDGLCRIRVLLIAPESPRDEAIEFHLQSVGRDGKELLKREYSDVQSGWLDVRFPAIQRSRGRRYHFYLSSKGNDEQDVRVAAAEGNPYRNGRAYGRGLPTHLDLRFEFFYEQDWKKRIHSLLFGKPQFPGKPFLIAVAFFGYNLLLMTILFKILPGVLQSVRTEPTGTVSEERPEASDSHA